MKLQIMTKPNVVHDIDATAEELIYLRQLMEKGDITITDFAFIHFPNTQFWIKWDQVVAIRFIKEEPKKQKRNIISSRSIN